jgi:hypothetical protein
MLLYNQLEYRKKKMNLAVAAGTPPCRALVCFQMIEVLGNILHFEMYMIHEKAVG